MAKKKKSEDFKKKYYDLKYPASYSGKRNFLNSLKPSERESAEKWLDQEHTYLIHKAVPKKFRRLRTVAGHQQQVQGDLVDLSYLAQHNNKNRYLFTVIDAFSRLGFAEPVANKESHTTAKAFERILKRMTYRPLYFFSDNGTEFRGAFRKMLQKHNIKFYTSKDVDIKAGTVERFNRTLMTRIFRYLSKQNSKRYLDALPNIIENYNKSTHSSIGVAPNRVDDDNKERVWLKLHHRCEPSRRRRDARTVFKKKDYVLIPKNKRTFGKAYHAGWTGEVFRINAVRRTKPRTYVLEDLQGEVISGTFYPQELQKTKLPEFYEIESVLDTRGPPSKREFYVRWKHYPAKFDQWISAKKVRDI